MVSAAPKDKFEQLIKLHMMELILLNEETARFADGHNHSAANGHVRIYRDTRFSNDKIRL